MKAKQKPFLVDVIESERGWGQRVDDTLDFATAEEADAYVAKFNARNTEKTVPDWYMYARRTN